MEEVISKFRVTCFTWMSNVLSISDCPVRHIDIMFVIDGSRSVNADHPDNFQIAKNWVRDITSKLDITENGIASVGVVQYSHYYKNR